MRIWKKLSLGKTRMGPHSGVTARCHPMIFPGGGATHFWATHPRHERDSYPQACFRLHPFSGYGLIQVSLELSQPF